MHIYKQILVMRRVALMDSWCVVIAMQVSKVPRESSSCRQCAG